MAGNTDDADDLVRPARSSGETSRLPPKDDLPPIGKSLPPPPKPADAPIDNTVVGGLPKLPRAPAPPRAPEPPARRPDAASSRRARAPDPAPPFVLESAPAQAPAAKRSPRRLGLGVAIVLGGALAALAIWAFTSWLARARRLEINLRAGEEAYVARDWPGARAAYAGVVADDPENAAARARLAEAERGVAERESLARVAKQLGDAALAPLEKRLELLAALAAEAPRTTDVVLAFARALRADADRLRKDGKHDGGPLERAAKALEKASAQGDAQPALLLERTLVADRQDEKGDGALLVELAQADPDGWRGGYARGRLALDRATAEQAELAFTKVLEHSRELPAIRLWRAIARLAQGRQDEAALDLEQAATLAPDDPRPRALRAELHAAANDWPAATEAAEQALKLAPQDPRALTIKAETLAAAGKAPEAKDLLDRVLARGDLPRARRARALLRAAARDPKALEDLAPAIKAFPEDMDLRAKRVEVLRLQRKFAQAMPDMNEVLKRRPDDVQMRVYRAETKAQHLQDAPGAREDAQHALRLEPRSWGARFVLGLCNIIEGDFAAALTEFDQSAELAPEAEKPWPLFQRAHALIRLRRRAEAQAALAELERRWPQHPIQPNVRKLKDDVARLAERE